MRLVRAADNAILLVFGDAITEAAHASVLAWFHHLRDTQIDVVTNLHPAYASLLVEFDVARTDLDAIERMLRTAAPYVAVSPSRPSRTIDVDVAYGGDDGPDLDAVARAAGVSPDDVVRLHSSVTYRVAFLGFAPGFAYLLGLPAALAVPRRDTPRSSVPAGSVAIGGEQTAIYPAAGPGGWQLIGRTSRVLAPDWVEPGDVVRLHPKGQRAR